MAKKRNSVRHAEYRKLGEIGFEREARDIAFEAKAQIEIRGGEVFIVVAGAEERLCTAELPKRLWWTIWRAMCQRFPLLTRYP
jgi:hypothetical protein